MPQAVVPRSWQRHTDGRARLEVEGRTVGAVVQELRDRYPGLDGWLDNGAGNLPAYTHIFLGEEDVRVLDDMDTPVDAEAEVHFLAEMSGGAS